MTKKIFKYKLELLNRKDMVAQMPISAKVLDVQPQHDSWVAWAEVDDEVVNVVPRYFHAVFTGDPVPPGVYRNTLQLEDSTGILVFHIYEEPAA